MVICRPTTSASLSRMLGACASALLLAGCVIPKDGPTGAEVAGSAEVRLEDPGRLSYAFVKLTPLTLAELQTETQPPVLFSRLAQVAPAAEARVTASDTLNVSIFEAAAGGLFIPPEAGARAGNFVQIPPQELDRNGMITIPYAGSIRALGRTPRDIEADIVAKLKERAIEPQAIVAIANRTANSVSVLGDVRSPTNIPMTPGGIRLLQALARAGGPQFAAHSTVVMIQRRGRTEQALLSSIIKDPRQNIQLAPEDVIYVSSQPRIFMAFGATGQQGAGAAINIGVSAGGSGTTGRRFAMDRDNMSVSEALAIAGGPSSGNADPRAVFVFRYVPRDMLARAGVDVSGFPAGQVPTVFSVDLSQAEGYFLANHLQIKHNDLLYVSESPSVDLAKFLSIINNVNSTVSGVLGTASQVQALRGGR